MSHATAPTVPATIPCPKCKQPLIDPKGLGWCKACGYCKSLEDSEKQSATADDKPKAEGGLAATGSAIAQSPLWIWVTLIGLIAVIAANWAVGKYVNFTPFNRALATSLQIGGALAFMFIGQFIGLFRLAPDDPSMSIKDVFFPFRLYGLALKYLPGTQWTIYFGVWGLAAIISTNIFIGGITHWLDYLPGNKNNPGQTQKFRTK